VECFDVGASVQGVLSDQYASTTKFDFEALKRGVKVRVTIKTLTTDFPGASQTSLFEILAQSFLCTSKMLKEERSPTIPIQLGGTIYGLLYEDSISSASIKVAGSEFGIRDPAQIRR